MLYVALALDPRFEALSFLSSEARDDKFSRLMMEAAALKQMRHLMQVIEVKKKQILVVHYSICIFLISFLIFLYIFVVVF